MASTPRDAASVICIRAREDQSYDVLLTLRPAAMRFMGGMYVFPGGALDPVDSGPQIRARSCLGPEQAWERLGEQIPESVALGLFCAAVRELFEETGLLLARSGTGKAIDPERLAGDYVPRRTHIARDALSFASFLESEDFVLSTDALIPHARLVTPEVSPIRFDARFFLAEHPADQEVVADPREVEETQWLAPSEAIRRSGAGEMAIAIPTMAVLQGLVEVPLAGQVLKGQRPTREILVSPLSPDVVSVLAPNPGAMTGPGTNTYVIGRGDVAIVDPGVDDPIFLEVVTREAMERGTCSMILITHSHPDHLGGAGILARQLGCPVAGSPKALDSLPSGARGMADGETTVLGDLTIQALHTPGHSSDHVCYLLKDRGELLAGDVVAGIGTVVIAPPDGDMDEYLTTLHRLRELSLSRIFPGHGPVIVDPAATLDEYIAHRLRREEQIVQALAEGMTRIPEMVARIYRDVPVSMHAMAELSVRAHLDRLQRLGRARGSSGTWELTG